MVKSVGIVAALIALVTVTIAQPKEVKESKPRTVAVRGLGTVMTKPDQLRLSIQVNTRGESASGAMREASRRTREIFTILESYGIETKDIPRLRKTHSAATDCGLQWEQ
jgi:uncharacterized protein YggE